MLVVCSGMYKSGSTLQYNVVREVLAMRGDLENHGFRSAADLRTSTAELAAWRDSTAWHLIKTHDLLPETVLDGDADRIYTLYTYRDLRDVAASVIRHFGKDHEELILLLQHAVDVQESAAGQGRFLQQQYEWFMQNPGSMVAEVFDFLGVRRTDACCRRIADAHSIARTQRVAGRVRSYMRWRALFRRLVRVAAMEGLSERLIRKVQPGFSWTASYHPTHLVHSGHMDPDSPGATGKWKCQLSEEIVATIESRFDPWLRAHHYVHES